MPKLAMEKCGFVVRLHLHVPVSRLGDTERVLNTEKHYSFFLRLQFLIKFLQCAVYWHRHKLGNRKCKNESARNHYEHKRVIKAGTVLSVCPVWLFL